MTEWDACCGGGVMTTLAEAIAKFEGDRHYSETEKEFLRRWAKNIVDRPKTWKLIEKKITDPEWLVDRAILLQKVAQEDAECGADSRLNAGPIHHKRLADLADMAAKLADYYKAKAGYPNPRIQELEKWSALIAEDRRRHADLIGGIKWRPLIHPVDVSQKGHDRERGAYMQRMSTAMKDKLGGWHDLIVAEITSLMYETPVSKKAVEKQRDRMLKNTPPFPAKYPQTG